MRFLIPFWVLLLVTTGSLQAVNSERGFSEEQVLAGSELFLENCPAREDATLSVGVKALPGFQAAVGRGRQA